MRAPDVNAQELGVYEDSVHHLLYQRFYLNSFRRMGMALLPAVPCAIGIIIWIFRASVLRRRCEPSHVFACFRQIQTAFNHIFDNIIGSSLPAARLRASIWQSIFTHDMRRYRRTMYRKMADFPTLITGPSGTGKELVARAIAGSRYVPFNADRLDFADETSETFLPINVAALSPTLIESELFGHRRGAFTGAIGDRKGWLETCPALGSVFLDELGEMDLSIQVKLLRVIETRRFSPVGDTAGAAISRQADSGDESQFAGGDSREAVSRGSVLPALRGFDRDAFVVRADRKFAGGSAGASVLYDAPRRGRGGGPVPSRD